MSSLQHSNGSGFRIADERFADSRDFWKIMLENPSYAASVRTTPEQAKEHLDILERFPPGISHTREVFNTVRVFAYEPFEWKKDKQHARPIGELVQLVEIDLNKEVLSGLTFKPEKDSGEPMSLDLGDGRILVGYTERISPHSGDASSRRISSRYLEIEYDASSYSENQGFHYGFQFNKAANTPDRPICYEVISDVRINNESIHLTSQKFHPVFGLNTNKQPHKLIRLDASSKHEANPPNKLLD